MDAALKTFKAAGMELHDDVAAARSIADVAAEICYFPQEAMTKRLYG